MKIHEIIDNKFTCEVASDIQSNSIKNQQKQLRLRAKNLQIKNAQARVNSLLGQRSKIFAVRQ